MLRLSARVACARRTRHARPPVAPGTRHRRAWAGIARRRPVRSRRVHAGSTPVTAPRHAADPILLLPTRGRHRSETTAGAPWPTVLRRTVDGRCSRDPHPGSGHAQSSCRLFGFSDWLRVASFRSRSPPRRIPRCPRSSSRSSHRACNADGVAPTVCDKFAHVIQESASQGGAGNLSRHARQSC